MNINEASCIMLQYIHRGYLCKAGVRTGMIHYLCARCALDKENFLHAPVLQLTQRYLKGLLSPGAPRAGHNLGLRSSED